MIGLHRHSHFSKRDAIAKIPDIVARTAQLGQAAWALTDHGTTSGLMEAYLETMKFNREHGTDIKFIFGVEAYWIPDYFIKDRKLSRHILLLAKNTVGYHNLLRLVTLGHGDKGNAPDNFYHSMRLTTDDIAKFRDGIIVSSACRGGILADRDYAFERAARFKSIFGDDFYFEIQTATDHEQRLYNLRVLELARSLDIKTIVTEDSHYVNRADADTHRKWLMLDAGSSYYSTDDFFLHSDQDVIDALPYVQNIESIIAETEAVAQKCRQVHIEFGEKHFPPVDCDDPKKAVVDFVRPFAVQKLNNKNDAEIKECRRRFKYELGVLERCDYLTYFLINARLTKWCRENDIHVGRGRGSVCGSLIAFLMDITRVDPTLFGLFFERFANVERVSPPDIDTDVPNSKRQAVIDYLKDTYRQVFHVRTFGTMADKAAVQRAAKALGLSPAQIRSLSAQIKSVDDVSDPQLKALAEKFVGVIQHFGIHASALIIFPSDPNDFCAIEKQGDDYVCAYQFPDLERMGLLKLDILGMKTLDTVDQAVKLIKQHRGVDVDLDDLPFDDPNTFEMLQNGDTTACFQIESDGMTKIIKALQPRSLFELIPLVALYRPSSIQSGVVDDYISRSKLKRIKYLHSKLKPILKDTFGVLLYQEQAMQIVQTVAGYSLAKADVFRRAIGHKDNAQMAALLEQFVKDGADHGFDADTMLKLAEWLKNCASYQFNKSHSAAYALLCYQTAFLKANFTVEFITAYLNSHLDDKQDELIPYIRYARNCGIEFLPPDIRSARSDWHIRDGKIVTAVNFIKGIGDIALPLDADALFSLPKNKLLNLIKAGALDHLGERRDLFRKFFFDDFTKRVNAVKKRIVSCQNTVGQLISSQDEILRARRRIEDYQRQIELLTVEFDNAVSDHHADDEFDVLGFAVSNPFKRADFDRFNEPDPASEDKRIVLCIVRAFKAFGNDRFFSARLTVETPSRKFFDLFMPSDSFAPLAVNSCCILSTVKNKISFVVSDNAWKI